jgi:hypothetical protein
MTIRNLGWIIVTASLATAGCGSNEQISAYTVPKERVPEERVVDTAPPAGTAATTDRMLAAVLPDGDRAWFFKATGPAADVDARADDIQKFFESVRLAPGKPHPDWQLPADWQQQPASAMRVATLLIPAGAKPLEMSVTVLPWPGPEAMLSNVNRWRGQMQLPPTDPAGLAKETRTLKVGDASMTIVDLSGQMTGGMTPPFAGGAMPGTTQPPATPAKETANALPPGHPPVGSPSNVNATPFELTAPAGWQSRPATGMRKAEFLITEGGQSATMTAIDFPASAGPMMADPVANLNRWRVEVGLPELAPDAANAAMVPIQVGGADGKFMAVIPDAKEPAQSQANRGTLAAMVRRGNTIWFFKLWGDRDLVTAQRNNFESLLKSVRFSGDGGANDGNE